MTVSIAQKVDLLYKQAFGVTKTDTETNKSPSNETIPSPLLLRGDTIWIESDQIPAIAAAVSGIVAAYTGSGAVQCTADNTTVPVGGVYPTWKTNLTNWIPSEFGSSYQIQVWVDSAGVANPTVTGTQIFAAGSASTGEFYFNPVSGVLNFIGGTIPAALTSSKVLYIVGYRYIGTVGLTGSGGDYSNANVVSLLASFGSNTIVTTGNISGNFVSPGSNTQLLFNSNGLISATPAVTFDSSSNTMVINGVANVGSLNVTGNITANNLGNIASINLNGNSSTVLSGDGTWINSSSDLANITISNTTISTGLTDANLVLTANGNGIVIIDNDLLINSNLTVINNALIGNTEIEDAVANTLTIGVGVHSFSELSVYSVTTSSNVSNQILLSIASNTVAGLDYVIMSTDTAGESRQITKLNAVIYDSALSYNETSTMNAGLYLGDWNLAYSASNAGEIQLSFSPASGNYMVHKMMITRYHT